MSQRTQTNLDVTEPAGTPAATPRQVSSGPQWVLVLLFLAIIAGVPLLQLVADLHKGEAGYLLDVFRRTPTSACLRAYEHSLEDASVVARAVRPWFQFVQFDWLRDGGKRALVGREGWLFYKPGYDDMVARHSGSSDGTSDAVAAIVAWRDALAARGIHLLVVPVPNKESIYPDFLTDRAVPGHVLMSPATRDLFARLKSANVAYVNLFDVFAKARTNNAFAGVAPLYLVQDSHWSPVGMRLAAHVVARRLLEKGWVAPGRTDYREKPAPVERLGDVLLMLQSVPIDKSFTPENVPCTQVVFSETGKLYQDQPGSQVLVLGDSFLRIYEADEPKSAGFIAHLAEELKQPLSSIVSDGGASTIVRQELYRRPELLRNKRVVVWEFVERDIHLATEGWQHVPLPPEETAVQTAWHLESTKASQ